MKTYTVKLKGTKKNNTPDLEVKVIAETKSQAFNFAYGFFQTGEFDKNTNSIEGNWVITDFIPSASHFNDFRGKYFVPRTAVNCVK